MNFFTQTSGNYPISPLLWQEHELYPLGVNFLKNVKLFTTVWLNWLIIYLHRAFVHLLRYKYLFLPSLFYINLSAAFFHPHIIIAQLSVFFWVGKRSPQHYLNSYKQTEALKLWTCHMVPPGGYSGFHVTGWSNRAKSQDPKKSLGLPAKPQKIPGTKINPQKNPCRFCSP